jgi:hypothetical protein
MGPRFRGDDVLRRRWPHQHQLSSPGLTWRSSTPRHLSCISSVSGILGPRLRGHDELRLVARQNKLSSPGAFLHLAPLAGRGRRRRAATSPGEGDSPRVLPCRESPSPQPSKSELRSSRPRKRDEGARRASHSTVIARLDRATQYAAASHSSCRGARATRTRNLEEQVHSTSRFRIGPHCGPSGMTEKHRC